MDRLLHLKKLLAHPLSILASGIFACLLALALQGSRKNALMALEERASLLYRKNHEMEIKKQKEAEIIARMKKANRVYVEEVLEKIVFLKPEIEKLQILCDSKAKNTALEERLHFLTSGKNSLHLKEKDFQQVGKLQEVDVIQDHPVEMSSDDLKHLLSQIEHAVVGEKNPEGNPPYFLIKKFDLLKKRHPSDEETFAIHLEMTKQEIANE